jgi:hypothetical protein
MKENNISRNYSQISDDELDVLVQNFKGGNPGSGLRYLIGFLRSYNLKLQINRIKMSSKRVDGLGHTLRLREVIRRRQYTVQRPNALWHVDGHHKLIRWGIVIHGFIDGYCRTVRSNDFNLLLNNHYLTGYGTPRKYRQQGNYGLGCFPPGD